MNKNLIKFYRTNQRVTQKLIRLNLIHQSNQTIIMIVEDLHWKNLMKRMKSIGQIMMTMK